jgi:hypothetical protein
MVYLSTLHQYDCAYTLWLAPLVRFITHTICVNYPLLSSHHQHAFGDSNLEMESTICWWTKEVPQRDTGNGTQLS